MQGKISYKILDTLQEKDIFHATFLYIASFSQVACNLLRIVHETDVKFLVQPL